MSLWKIDNNIAKTLKKLPSRSGVYLFRDSLKTVLYVGRATSLKSRVSSYFSGRDSRGERIFQMVDRARSVETIETETVLESIILEANLIKKYRPKYNVDLKDDKSFSYFVVTKEEFPRVVIVRETEVHAMENRKGKREKEAEESQKVNVKRQKYSRVYGPYPSKRHMETVLKILRKIFPFHSGKAQSEKGCLYRQIGLCPGPYDGGIGKEAYRKNICSIEYVLRGQKKRLLATLEKEMAQEAKKENFERAKVLRDQVFALRHIRDIALLTNDQRPTTHDISTLYTDQQVTGESFLPDKSRESKVVSRRSIRFEAYDISNISGQHAVASMVVFENGEPKKSEYRKFKIKSVSGANDIAMIREVLARRVRHTEWGNPLRRSADISLLAGGEHKKGETSWPDMIILDGGKGHLAMAVSLWKALNISIPLVAIAKGPTRKKVELHIDPHFAPDPELLKDLRVLEHLREEAHRFAITYHRKVRGKDFLQTKNGEDLTKSPTPL